MNRALVITLAAFAAILGLCLLRYAPPRARGPEAPVETFSAARAREVQAALAGAPRPIGSPANARARGLLEAELRKAGWSTELQTAMSCTRHGACAEVTNLIATRTGREPTATSVLLMAHHDSVPCSPGAGDDGFGTAAVIEAARALAAGPPLRRTVVVVLTDGEEAGLLGSEAFVREHPLARNVRGVVNVDSRGSAGPSAMFETSPGNGWIIDLLARNVDRPVTSSLFYEIYRRMPNDTDFTAVKGIAHGVNFANIGGVASYHTPLDSLANADPGTLQHHGEQALAMVRALAEAGPELDAPRDVANDAVWFDVLALFIVRWPAAVSLGIALAALALIVGWVVRDRAWRGSLRGFAAAPAALVASALAGIALGGGLHAAGALPVPWVAHPFPALLALHGSCLVVGLTVGRLVGGRSRAQALWAGTWLTWGVLGVVLARVAPGASFLFVVPTLAAGLVAWSREDLAAAIPAVVAALLWLPLVLLVHDGLGLKIPMVTSIASIVLVTTLVSVASANANANASAEGAEGASLSRRRVGAGALAVVIGATLVAALMPPYSASVPQRVNVVFRQDDEPGEGAARVHVETSWAAVPWGVAPAAMKRALGDPSRTRSELPSPWSSPVLAADVPRVVMPAPEAVVEDVAVTASTRKLRLRLRSARGGTTLGLVLPADRQITVLVRGRLALPRRGAIAFRGVPAEGVAIELSAEGPDPVDLTVLDMTPGLPPAEAAPVAHAVHEARGASGTATAVQTQDGDLTIASRRARL